MTNAPSPEDVGAVSSLAPPGPYTALPAGWFCVALSDEVPRGAVVRRYYFGRELVLYRGRSGRAHLIEAYCPHMGAHLGHVGTVVDDELRCGFHGFRYGADGLCTHTPYGQKLPTNARLTQWALREMNGVLLAWYHPQGVGPDWEIAPLASDGWTGHELAEWTFRGHPQETSENSVDLGHFDVVHRFSNSTQLEPVTTEGPALRTKYAVDNPVGPAKVRAEFDVLVHGLGYSLVSGEVPRFGVRFRELVLATPVEVDKVHLRLLVSTKGLAVPGIVNRVLNRFIFATTRDEVERDFKIWHHKIYLHPPRLAQGDGPIGIYRRWCKQFYPAPDKARAANRGRRGRAGETSRAS